MEIAWEDYRCYIGGRFVTGVRGFMYGKNRNKEHIWAEGSDPAGIGRGNATPRCELKVLRSELEAIIIASGGDPTDMSPFLITHQYVRRGTTAVLVDVVEDVEIMDYEKAMDQGATFQEVTLQCICRRIHNNVNRATFTQRFNINLQ